MSNPLVRGYQYATCRLLGHQWHIVPSDWTPQFGSPMTCRCAICNIERRDTLGSNTGEVLGRRYTYPTGYQFSRDGNDAVVLPSRTDFRLAWLEGEVADMRKRRADRAAKQKERIGR